MTEQRRLAAIVSADVAGYSRLMGRDESGTLAALKALRQEVVDPAIASHGGRIVKTTGDGLLLEFPSVVNAVRCAVEVQTAMADRTARIAEDRRVAFRIGINIGDIIVEGDDIFGDGVNVAARLQEIAAPGGICISSRVHEDVRDRLDTAFDDGGAQTLKNIARPVQVWRWQPGMAVVPKPAPPPTALPLPDKPSIAVLPFQNMSGDPEQEYFVDGLVEDIITGLSRFKSLFVIARNSSFTYKGKAVDIKQVSRELGVRYVLEGSIRKAANRVRITGQLVESDTGNHLWADRFDGALEDVFTLQDVVTEKVIAQLAPSVEQAEIERARRKPTQNLGAYDCYLRGLALFQTLSRENFDEAIGLFRRALALDSEHSSALGRLLACLATRKGWGIFDHSASERTEVARLVPRRSHRPRRCGCPWPYWLRDRLCSARSCLRARAGRSCLDIKSQLGRRLDLQRMDPSLVGQSNHGNRASVAFDPARPAEHSRRQAFGSGTCALLPRQARRSVAMGRGPCAGQSEGPPGISHRCCQRGLRWKDGPSA